MRNKGPLDHPEVLAARQARNEKHRLDGFHALVEDHKHSGSHYEEMDGTWREWPELSAEGKLSYLAGDAAYYDVQFDHFAAAAHDVLNGRSPAAREDAALRLLLSHARKLQGLARLLPDDGRTEPTPLIDRFRKWWGMKTEDRNLLLAQDAIDSTKTQLESFSDEFGRLARTEEQKQLADHFKEFVHEVTGAGMRQAFEKILEPKPAVLFADSAAAPKESPPIQPERPQRHEKLGSSANELIRDVADDNLQEAFQRILEMRSGPSAAIDSQQELPGQGNSEVKQPEPTRGIKR